MVGFVGNLILLLVESTLGQLPFPKCYLSTLCSSSVYSSPWRT